MVCGSLQVRDHNLRHSSNLHHSSGNIGSLTCWATRELLTLSFNNLLEELTELTGSCYTHGTVYYSEKTQIKANPRKICTGQSPGGVQT